MEKPTCASCIFWECGSDGEESRPTQEEIAVDTYYGACRRQAPVAVWEKHGGPLFIEQDMYSLVSPTTADYDWCGEHPDFPAYIEAKKKEQAKAEAMARPPFRFS